MRLDGTRPDRREMIANQMMKSMTGNGYSGRYNGRNNTAGDREEIEEFKRVYARTISYLDKRFSRKSDAALSVGVLGALGKAILWYGFSRMKPFIDNMINRDFKGRNDPCFVLWEWIINNTNKRLVNESYNRTVSAIRYYINGKECKELRLTNEDIFEWDGDFRHMCQYKQRNQYTTIPIKSICKQPDEAIEAEIEEILSACPT